MSTSIKEIKGRYESNSHADFTADYKEISIHLNRFAGGIKNGAMLQLTLIGKNDGYIQLTKDQVKDLIEALSDAFDYEKYPSD